MDTGMRIQTPPKAVIFDWDDTVVDNWQTSLKALNTALAHMGHKMWSDDEARRNAMYSARDLFGKLFGDRWQEADKVFYDTYYSLVLDNVRLHDGIEDLFKMLSGQDIPLFVVSNKRGALLRREVEHLGFTPYFKKVVGAGDAKKDKPDAAPVFYALADSQIQAGPDIWFVGDSQTDMICAQAANCTPVLIETKLPPEELLSKNPPALRFKDHLMFMEYLEPYFG